MQYGLATPATEALNQANVASDDVHSLQLLPSVNPVPLYLSIHSRLKLGLPVHDLFSGGASPGGSQ